MERKQVPAFGLWNACELQDLYFQSAYKLEFREDGGLKANCQLHHPQKFQYGRNRVKDAENKGKIQAQRRHRIPKAVDEDLYKIPPELLYQKSNRRRCVRSFWLGCLGLNCIP